MNACAVSPNLEYSPLPQSFIDVLPDPCVLVDQSGTVTDFNAAWMELVRETRDIGDESDANVTDYLAVLRESRGDLDSARMGIIAVLRGYRRQFEQEYVCATQSAVRRFRMIVRTWHEPGGDAIIFHREIDAQEPGRTDGRTADVEFGCVGPASGVSDQERTSEAANQAIRYLHIVKDIATIANSATTLREALQRSLEVICETMGFAVGHAFLVREDEPEQSKPSHIMQVKDGTRFERLIEMSNRIDWVHEMGTSVEMPCSTKPVILDAVQMSQVRRRYSRANAALAAGLRAAIHVPILVDGELEAVLEFATEERVEASPELMDTLVAASERLSRFFERRRAQVKFLQQQEQLQASAGQLFAMAGRLVDSQEAERRRIAREIHDDFTQRLATVCMKLSELGEQDHEPRSGKLNANLEEIRKSIGSVADDLRDLSHHLRPATLDLLGLVHSLRAQCNEFQRLRKIETRFEVGACDGDASPETATCLYRVLQEGLMNIARHSDSRTASVTLSRQGDYLEMRIRDEGRGFISPETGGVGIGLMNISDRMRLLGGDLKLNSRPGSGTEVVVRVPASMRNS